MKTLQSATIVFALALITSSCGDELQGACQHDCEETHACAEAMGYSPTYPIDTCVKNCLDLHDNQDTVDEMQAIYELCGDQYSCDWADCVMEGLQL